MQEAAESALFTLEREADNRFDERRRSALADLTDGLSSWRIWGMLALSDIRRRYRRSRFGQFWLTLSMGCTIGALALVYSVLLNQPVEKYIPFITASLIVWTFVSAIVTESAHIFIEAEACLRNAALPKSLFIFRILCRNLIVFGHNLTLMLIVGVFLGVEVGPATLLLIPGAALAILNGVWIGLLLGPLAARFRDLPQITASAVQMMFFLSPVLWPADQLGGRLPLLTTWNPLTSFLDLMRDPLQGRAPEAWDYALVGAVTIVGFAIALPFFARFRARIIYYL